jgi:hypothetical protein
VKRVLEGTSGRFGTKVYSFRFECGNERNGRNGNDGNFLKWRRWHGEGRNKVYSFETEMGNGGGKGCWGDFGKTWNKVFSFGILIAVWDGGDGWAGRTEVWQLGDVMGRGYPAKRGGIFVAGWPAPHWEHPPETWAPAQQHSTDIFAEILPTLPPIRESLKAHAPRRQR